VIYGDKQPPISIAMDDKVLARQLERPGFLTHCSISKLRASSIAFCRANVQFDPVSDRPLHIDFLRVSASTMVPSRRAGRFLNPEKSPGISAAAVEHRAS